MDIVLSKVSPQRPLPKIFKKQWFRWMIFVLFISFLAFRIIFTEGNFISVGAVFVTMCLMTTIIAIVLGLLMKQRAWCMICPMGTLQEKIGRISKRK